MDKNDAMLFRAIKEDDIEDVEIAIKQLNANVNAKDAYGNTVLSTVKDGDNQIEILKLLLQQPELNINYVFSTGMSELGLKIVDSRWQMIRHFLKRKDLKFNNDVNNDYNDILLCYTFVDPTMDYVFYDLLQAMLSDFYNVKITREELSKYAFRYYFDNLRKKFAYLKEEILIYFPELPTEYKSILKFIPA